jgi:DNA-binding winged helix-turn-helix (wHTH) protein
LAAQEGQGWCSSSRIKNLIRELIRDGRPIVLEPRVFDPLIYLIKNRDRVVSKGDLIAGVWAAESFAILL